MFILSGSQKLELMKGMSESLAGRVSVTELSGLSLREIHKVKFNKHFVPTEEYLKEVERVYFLRILDSHWMDHIDYMDRSRQGAHLQSYGQRDPIAEYRDDMFNHFDRMMYEISKEFLELLFHTKFVETSDISEDSTEKSDSPKGFDD